jgi:protein-tyrosine-phosphatase
MEALSILLGFAESLAAIEVAASLREAGYEVFLFTRENGLTALAHEFFSQRIESIVAPEDDIGASLLELRAMWEELGRPIIFPLDDVSLWLVNSLALQVPEVVFLGARGAKADIALDKKKQIEVARAAGFDVLTTSEPDGIGLTEFPVFARARYAVESVNGRITRTGACRISSPDDLHKLEAAGGTTVIQRCVDGTGEGIFGLAQNGRLIVASGHRRVRMMNPMGSGSSACEPRVVSDEDLGKTRRFLELSGWDGLFMLELLRDSSGISWFVELNGRPWGSMALARAQGYEYPRWAADQFLGKPLDVDSAKVAALEGPQNFETRHFGRELIHLAHLVLPGYRSGGGRPSLISSLKGMVLPGRQVTYYNLKSCGWRIFLWDTLYCLARHDRNSRIGRLISVPGKIARRWRSFCSDSGSIKVRRELRGKIVHARTIAVVCYGNINRSPVAEAALSEVLPDDVRIESYGLHRRSGRPADQHMLGVAHEMGIDLSHHSSRTFSNAVADEADLILVMERWHLAWLQARYPKTRGKVFLMGALDDGHLEIADPFNKKPEVYANVVRQIVSLAYLAKPLLQESGSVSKSELC